MPLCENDAACARCGFSLEIANRRLGIAPMLEALVSDTSGILSRSAIHAIEKSVRQLEQRFPQIGFAAVLTQVPADVSPSLYAFWLFNRGSLSSAVEKGGENHRILLLLDTAAPRAAVTLGYGLEPFVAEEHLDACLRIANAALANRRYTDAVEAFVTELQRRLTIICRRLPRTFGYAEDPDWIDSTRETGNGTTIHANGPDF